MAAARSLVVTLNPIEVLRHFRHRAHAEHIGTVDDGAAAFAAWTAAHGDGVVAGPFRGMRYPRRWGDASAPAKWLGSYERELAESVEAMIARNPVRVVVVGSADGYYSVGFSLRLPEARIEAFDPEWLARINTVRLARLNGSGVRLALHGLATPERLSRVLGHGSALVICDCEGGEDILIDPVRAPALARCDLIVEIHEREDKTVGARIAARFPDHRVEWIESRVRDMTAYPALLQLPEPLRRLVVREFREFGERWLVLRAPCGTDAPAEDHGA